MANNINIDQLSNEIAQALSVYKDDVIEKVDVSSERVGKAAVKKLKETSPKRKGKGGGAYAKSWRMDTVPAIAQPVKRIIHVTKPHYRLTHLLEHGHAKRNGGRVEAIPHIKPAEEEVIREFTQEVEEAIKNG